MNTVKVCPIHDAACNELPANVRCGECKTSSNIPQRMNTIKTWQERMLDPEREHERFTDSNARERVAYLESYTESQKDAMRVTMDELATVREALRSTLDDLGQLTQKHMELRRTMREHKNEREALQAKLSAMEKQEPVGEGFFNAQGKMCSAVSVFGYLGITEQEAAGGCKISNIYCAPVAPAQPSTPLTPKGMTDAVMCLADVLARDPASTKLIAPQAWAHLSVYMPAQPVNELVGFQADRLETIIDNYIEDYEMLGEDAEGRDAHYIPNENDRALLKDAILGLLADTDWDAAWGKHIDALANTKAAQPVNELVEALESIKQSSFNARFVAARALNAFANAKASQPLTKEQVEKVLAALETIRYSMVQAQIPGNDRLREIELSLGTAREAIEIMERVRG